MKKQPEEAKNTKTPSKKAQIIPKVPTEDDIREKFIKRETVPVAFRIDELTYAALDLYAKDMGITLSALENALHDSFVEETVSHPYSLIDDEACRHHAFNLYLDRVATKLSKMSEGSIIEEYLNDYVDSSYRAYTKAPLPPKSQRKKIYRTFISEIFTKNPIELYTNDIRVFNLAIGLTKYDVYTLDINEYMDEELQDLREELLTTDCILWIPAEKWAVASALLQEFGRKYAQLFNDPYHGPFGSSIITEGLAEDEQEDYSYLVRYAWPTVPLIAKTIKAASVENLATELAEALKVRE